MKNITFFNFEERKTRDYLKLNSLNYNLVIIGTGFAAYVIAKKLSKTNKILLIEKGTLNNRVETFNSIENLGKIKLKSNTFNEVIGGTSMSWSGNLCEYDNSEFGNNLNNNCEWEIKKDILKYYPEAWRMLGIFFRKNQKSQTFNNDFKFRKIVTQHFPTRINKLLNKLKIDIIFNAKVDRIGENDKSFIVINDKYYYFKKIILANGGIGSIKIIKQSVDNNLLKLNFSKGFIGRFYMNHPKFKINKFLIPKKDDRIIKLYNKNKYNFIGYSLHDKVQIYNNLNNTYFRLHPRFFAEQTREFKVVNLIFSDKKKLLIDALNLNFNSKTYSKIKKLLSIKSFVSYFKILFNFKIYCFILFFIGIKKLRVKYYDLEYYFELSKNKNNFITFNGDHIRTNINLSNNDIETFDFLHSKLIKTLKKNHKINNKFKKIDLEETLFNDAAHHIGGLNYKNFSSYGFVDKNCRLNNTRNIFICSSSLFPTAGSGNPTLTIATLAIKLSNYLSSIRM